MNDIEHLKTKTITDLAEIAHDYGLNFSHSDGGQFVYFSKYECGLLDPSFMVTIEYNICKAYISCLSKSVELHQLKDCVRLLAQCIS